MVFQEFSLISTLTVAQNIFLDSEPTRRGLIDDGAMRSRAGELLARIDVAIDPSAEVGTLSHGAVAAHRDRQGAGDRTPGS